MSVPAAAIPWFQPFLQDTWMVTAGGAVQVVEIQKSPKTKRVTHGFENLQFLCCEISILPKKIKKKRDFQKVKSN